MPHPREYTPAERAMLVSWWLANGECLTTGMLTEKFRINHSTAWRMLRDAERVLPVVGETYYRRMDD